MFSFRGPKQLVVSFRMMTNLTLYPTNKTNSTDWRPGEACGVFIGTSTEWHLIVTAGLIMAITIILANMVNLLIFRRWKKKHAFLLFHVALSYAELGYGCVLFFAPLSHIFDPMQTASWPKKITSGGVPVFAHICHCLLATMSVDRWLSTEYPVFYKHQISARKVNVVVGFIWFFYLGQYTLVYSLFRANFQVICNKVVFFDYPNRWWTILTGVQYPIYVSIMTITQIRIALLAIRAKFCVRRSRQIVNVPLERVEKSRVISDTTTSKPSISSKMRLASAADTGRRARSAGILLRAMWKTVLAGSVVVVIAILCNVPLKIVTATATVRMSNETRMISYLVSNFQYVSPTLIYVLCYANFRRCVAQMFSCA